MQASPATGLVSVVIPAWDEADNIRELIERVRSVLAPLADAVEILVVVPSPNDATVAAARAAGAEVIVQKRPGYGGALREGLAATRGDYVVTMNADLSHPPEAIRDIMARRDEAEVVIASRYIAGAGSARMSRKRAFLSQVLNRIYRRVLAVPVLDMSSGFRGYQRMALDELELECEKFDVLEEILVKTYSRGWQVAEIPFDFESREAGRSHAEVWSLAPNFLTTLVRLWIMRNSHYSADYDSRAYDSLVPPQRYWQRKRFEIVNDMAGDSPARLDIGCGSSRIIQSRPDSVGLDLDPSKLRFLRKTNPRLIRATCAELPFADHSFETVVDSQLIEHVPYRPELFTELNRVMKPGGLLVIGTPDYGRAIWRIIERIYQFVLPYAYADDHITHYTRFSLTEELAQAGFAIESYRYILGGELVMRCIKREEVDAPSGQRDNTVTQLTPGKP